MKPSTYTDFQDDVLTLEDTEKSKRIVVYNDDVNSFQHVIKCLVKYCKHEELQAEQSALIIHTKGKSSVKEGNYDTLKPIKDALTENGIDAKIEE